MDIIEVFNADIAAAQEKLSATLSAQADRLNEAFTAYYDGCNKAVTFFTETTELAEKRLSDGMATRKQMFLRGEKTFETPTRDPNPDQATRDRVDAAMAQLEEDMQAVGMEISRRDVAIENGSGTNEKPPA